MKEFTALKFRTMKVGTDPVGHRAASELDVGERDATEDGGVYKLERADA